MGADEEGTHERLKAHLGDLVEPKIEEHRGRIVKTTGDGVLAEFASVVDAVRCAGEIQRAMADRDMDLAEERRLRFRIGVNLGDVIADGGDIYGDGVNIAARLEGLAAPGGICVSGTVRDHIGDRLPYAFENMGEQSVKNIARPIRVYALRPEAIAELPATSVVVEVRRQRRIAPAVIVAAVAAGLVIAAADDKALFDTGCGGNRVSCTASRRAAPVVRRVAVRQSEQRPRPAIFRRRDHRRSDNRSVADRGHGRDLAQYRVHL
jgi:adenylate cyclase